VLKMFIISVERRFRASHQLILPDGSKEPVHNHDWVVIAEVGSEKLNNIGVVMNFQKLQAMIDEIVAGFSNKPLETVGYFQQNNPSAENVSKYIYEKLQVGLAEGVELRSVRVVEEPGCSATYQK
jgi:6-pyruvoyltetrahydropterin/6-carboxytetrahydropterin synthase